MNLLTLTIICLYIAINIVTSKMMDAKEMKRHFINGQCIVGRIAANAFYGFAWLLKGIKFVIIKTVK